MSNEEISEEVFKQVQHRSLLKTQIRNKLFENNPQEKLLDYLVNLELRLESLERNFNV